MMRPARTLCLLVIAVALVAPWTAANAARPAQVTTVPDVDIVASPPSGTSIEPTLDASFGRDLPVELQSAIQQALRLPVLKGARVGLYAARVSDGAPLVSLNADDGLNPASCVKLFTSATALRVLRPNYRFITEYLGHGTMEGTTLKGDLVVRGTGDPTVSPERLFHVATEMNARGLSAITGDIILDDSWFDGVNEPPGWEQENQWDRAYAAPTGALSLKQNTIAIYVRPGEHHGARGVVQVEPPTETVVVESQVITTRYGRRLWVKAVPDGAHTRVLVQGVIGINEPAERYVRRVHNPTQHFGGALISMLKARGISVKGRVRTGLTPENTWQLFEDRSPSLRIIVTNLNHHSSNFVAEMILKAVGAHMLGAPGSTDKGLRVVSALMEREVGIASGSYIMGNGSGLNDVNRFSAGQIVKVLRRMALDPTLSPEFMGSLAVAGSTGTLSHRMVQTSAEGQLRAKTGTLMGVSALSGFVETPKHGLVAFSILVNGLSGPASGAWELQDKIGTLMAGDRPAYALGEQAPAALPDDDKGTESVPGGGTP